MPSVQDLLATRARGRTPSPIRELVPLMRLPGMISLGGGYPNPDTFVFERIEAVCREGTRVVLEGPALAAACQYGPSEGQAELREVLRDWHRRKDGVALGDDQLVVLNGSQEGLFIAAYLLLEPDDTVVVSEPDYPGALSAFASFCRNTLAVPLDEHGLDTAALGERLAALRAAGRRLPKLVYCVPNGHNPGGVTLSVERRHELVELAARYDLLVLEDDPYQLVRLDGSDPPPTLQSLAPARVLRLDSFSKIFTPGLRLGYATGPAELIRQFVLFKQAANLHTSSLAQALLERFLGQVGHDGFRAHIRRNCQLYRRNRDALIEAAREHLPAAVRFNVPTEGMFVWFVLPDGCDARRMMDDARAELVLAVPGGAFSTTGGLANCLRASFSMIAPEQIREAMRRLGRVVARELARAG